MTQVWGPSFPIGGFWGSPDATAQDWWGQAPLGKSGVHRITRCPSLLGALREISLLTLPVFQGAAVSSERFSQSLPHRNVAELRGSPPPLRVSRAARAAGPCRSSASGHRASSSKYTRGQSWETGSLSRLFGSMETAAKCVSMGHAHCRTRLCGALPQPFNGVTPMLVSPEQALVMEQEVSTLLRKETIEVVPPLDKESGFYSRTSLFLGKGLRPS